MGHQRIFVSYARKDGAELALRLQKDLTAAGFEVWIDTQRIEGGIRLHDLQLNYVRAKYPDREALALIHGAVRLSAHVIEKDARQFASQVVGRLLPYRETPAIGHFIDEIAAGPPRPWLRPLPPALHPPGTPLLRTLAGHSHVVSGVAVTPDGKRAVSASRDHTLKVWDLDTGLVIATFHCDGSAQCCAFVDDHRIVAGDGGGCPTSYTRTTPDMGSRRLRI